MNAERKLARFVHDLQWESVPADAITVARQILLAVTGTMAAGASEDGCGALREMLLAQGGRPEATVVIFGDKLPAASAALLNGVMGRALDFCDAMVPGLHIGSALVPAALAAAELAGGCDGMTFLTALVAGAEVASRLNGEETDYDGFDPTGVAGVFASTAAAARILGLDEEQTLNALALAFNRCGGSFQSNVDASLAVRLIQGWVAESGVICARLAKAGLTGPANFLDGVYGYMHLFGRGRRTGLDAVSELGRRWALKGAVFKRYPSCGLTQAVTDLALRIRREASLSASQVESIEIRLPPYAYKLVGGPFEPGSNPRVNAQFSARYCVANALVRGDSNLNHFRPDEATAPEVLALASNIRVVSAPELDQRGHTAVDLAIGTRDGAIHSLGMDIAPGFPGNPLNEAEHLSRYRDCMDYAAVKLPQYQIEQLFGAISALEGLPDAAALVQLLVIHRS